MSHQFNEGEMSLEDLRRRIEDTDLIPSRRVLVENIQGVFAVLRDAGYGTVAALRKALKTAKGLSVVAAKTGLSVDYLTLLRREIEGYFPKPVPLKAFDWIPGACIAALEQQGCKDSASLFAVLHSTQERKASNAFAGIDSGTVDELGCLVDLVRIQWVSPVFARVLYHAGYRGAQGVAKANAEELCNRLDRVNRERGFFKGRIGLRDTCRLIKAAHYIPGQTT